MTKIIFHFYAIKHVRRRLTLPDVGRGATHAEPVVIGGPWPPRLFHTEAAAKQSLSWWLKGRTTVSRGRRGDWTGVDDYEDWHTEPDPSRREEDWTVVPVRMEIENGR